MPSERRSLKFYQADVFSAQPFGGNPVAVFPEAQGLTDDQLQQIAREMNLSETVFVFPPTDPAAVVRLRIFTPTQEIPFAGHPVVGTMHVLAQLGMIATPEPVTRVVQECNIGLFPVDLLMRDGQVMRVVMTQPEPQFLERIEDTEDLYKVAAALGIPKHTITDTKWPLEVVSTGLPVLIVPVRTLTAVRSINPDPSAIVDLCGRFGANGITAFTTVTVEPFSNVHSRMFAPAIGIPEDPATGSATCAAVGLLAHLDKQRSGEFTYDFAQGVEMGRPSTLRARAEKTNGVVTATWVGGPCVMVSEGFIHVD